MNIFYLDHNPISAAQMHNDKHVVKMILESAQILSTVHWYKKSKVQDIYKPTHVNHPCVLWAYKDEANYNWLHFLASELCKEYTFRYGKIHKTQSLIDGKLARAPFYSVWPSFSVPPQCMPEDSKHEDTIQAYRNYYMNHKRHIASWKKRGPPSWWK